MFHIGQKVVCVAERWYSVSIGIETINYPIKDKIYTIRYIKKYFNGNLGFHLNELYGGLNLFGEERHFMSTGFRPIIERKTDISIFNEILNNVGKGKKVKHNELV